MLWVTKRIFWGFSHTVSSPSHQSSRYFYFIPWMILLDQHIKLWGWCSWNEHQHEMSTHRYVQNSSVPSLPIEPSNQHTHTHTHTSWLQESRKLQEWNRIAGKQQTWPLMVNGGIWKTHWISCWKSLGKEFRFDVLLSLPLVAALLDNVFVL